MKLLLLIACGSVLFVVSNAVQPSKLDAFGFELELEESDEEIDDIEHDNAALELVDVSEERAMFNPEERSLRRLGCGKAIQEKKFKKTTADNPIMWKTLGKSYPNKANCISDVYVPKGKKLIIEFVHMDFPTDNPKKCKHDYLRIKGSNKTKFYCGTWDNRKMKEMGPWGKDYRFQISFRSNNDDENGKGAKLYLYASE